MSASPGRVLVVDDDDMVASTLASMLGREGYRVDKFSAPREALSFLRTERVDAVLSDVSMPGLTGIELLERIRKVAGDVPVVFVTGVPRLEDTLRAMELGAFRYLTKPIDRDALRTVIAAAIKWGRLSRASHSNPALRGERDTLDRAFENALATTHLHYQPIVSTNGRRPFGYEALLRSEEPTLPSPPAVLDAAERLGRLHTLARRIRGLVAEQASSEPFEHAFFVNIHPSDLADPELYDEAAPLSRHARSVVLEITERASLEGVGALEQRLGMLRAMGYRIALDDLGAGYAGLTDFARLSPDIVKIDMSLTRGIDADTVKQRVVGSMCQLARDLDMLIVAEGVETEGELAEVSRLGIDLAQGWVLGRPGPWGR